jgi:hypothetical protein
VGDKSKGGKRTNLNEGAGLYTDQPQEFYNATLQVRVGQPNHIKTHILSASLNPNYGKHMEIALTLLKQS